jgi:hypothetical protein
MLLLASGWTGVIKDRGTPTITSSREARISMSTSRTRKLELVDSWCEVEGREGERLRRLRPLADSVALHIAVKNIGTKPIDHFTWQQTASIAHMKMDLLHPKIPSQLWKPFAGNLLSSVLLREISLKDGQLEIINPALPRLLMATSPDPIPQGGIQPGDTFIAVEASKPYLGFLEEGIEIKGEDNGILIKLSVADKEEGILDLVIEEYKFGPIVFHDMRLQIIMRGKITTVQEILIDGRRQGARELEWEYL